jgi:putative chitinase
LATPEGACRSALWYWTVNGLNRWCDQQDVVTLTRRINGGTHGLDDRQRRWQLALRVLGG